MPAWPALTTNVRATLARTPQVLVALLEGVPEDVASSNEGPGTWSARQIVAHLIEGERTDWIPRVRTILQHGPGRAFEPFEREPPERAGTVRELLAEFANARAASLQAWRELGIDEADPDRQGRHPEFGVVTLRELIATWAAHDLSHIRQVARVLSKQFADDVGPWIAYLPVLRESGGDSGGRG